MKNVISVVVFQKGKIDYEQRLSQDIYTFKKPPKFEYHKYPTPYAINTPMYRLMLYFIKINLSKYRR